MYELCTRNWKQHLVLGDAFWGDLTIYCGGGYRNRTGVHGFAIRCITTLPTRPGSTWTWATSPLCVVTLKLDGMQEAGTVIQSDCRGIFFAKGRVHASLSEKLPFNRMGCILFSPIIWENLQRLFHFSVCASSLVQFALGWPLVRNFLMIFRIATNFSIEFHRRM